MATVLRPVMARGRGVRHSVVDRRRLLLGLALLPALAALPFTLAESVVGLSASGRCFDRLDGLPAREVALVLGTSPRTRFGGRNPYYESRLDAAAALWRAGKVQYLLVSGDNGTRVYDEPAAMRRGLIARGIPKQRIVCDYAGFRTLDSVVRARKVFGQSALTIVSQRFHNERALFLARDAGLDAVAFDASDSGGGPGMWGRERLARVAALLDTWVLHRQPRFLGPAIPIGDTAVSPTR